MELPENRFSPAQIVFRVCNSPQITFSSPEADREACAKNAHNGQPYKEFAY
jgi:hypothetical protein